MYFGVVTRSAPRWNALGVDGKAAEGLQSPHRVRKALCGSCDARDGERIRSRGLSRPGWRELSSGPTVAHPPYRLTQEVGGATGGVGQVGVGAEAIRPAPPESGPAGAVEASRTRRTGATRPKTGGSTVCGGIHVGVRAGRASMGLSRRGARPAPGPAVDRSRRSGRRSLRRSVIEACLGPLAHRPPRSLPAPPVAPTRALASDPSASSRPPPPGLSIGTSSHGHFRGTLYILLIMAVSILCVCVTYSRP